MFVAAESVLIQDGLTQRSPINRGFIWIANGKWKLSWSVVSGSRGHSVGRIRIANSKGGRQGAYKALRIYKIR